MKKIIIAGAAILLLLAAGGCVWPKAHVEGMRGQASFPASRPFKFHGTWTAGNGSRVVLRQNEDDSKGYLMYEQACSVMLIFPFKTIWSGHFMADDEKGLACVTAAGTQGAQKSKVLLFRVSDDGKTLEVKDWGEDLGSCDPGEAEEVAADPDFDVFYAYTMMRPPTREGHSLMDSLGMKKASTGAAARASLLVAAFKPVGASQVMADFQAEVVARMIGSLPGLAVLTKEDVKTLLTHESERQLFGSGDEASAMKVGAALGAPYLISGKVIRPSPGNIFVTLNLFDVNKSRMLSTGSVKVPEHNQDEMVYKVSQLVKNILRDSGRPELKAAVK